MRSRSPLEPCPYGEGKGSAFFGGGCGFFPVDSSIKLWKHRNKIESTSAKNRNFA